MLTPDSIGLLVSRFNRPVVDLLMALKDGGLPQAQLLFPGWPAMRHVPTRYNYPDAEPGSTIDQPYEIDSCIMEVEARSDDDDFWRLVMGEDTVEVDTQPANKEQKLGVVEDAGPKERKLDTPDDDDGEFSPEDAEDLWRWMHGDIREVDTQPANEKHVLDAPDDDAQKKQIPRTPDYDGGPNAKKQKCDTIAEATPDDVDTII